MSEAHETPYIPGDTVKAYVPPFEHDQNLNQVVAVYGRPADGVYQDHDHEFRLTGEPERNPYAPKQERGEPRASHADVRGEVWGDTPPGRYTLRRIEGLTFTHRTVVFDMPDPHPEGWGPPFAIVVGPEPQAHGPRFLYLDE